MTILRIVDFETTGLEPPDAKVIEVALCDLTRLADGSWEIGDVDSWLCGGVDAIPPEVRAVHHISMDDLVGALPFNRQNIFDGTVPAAIVAHNYDFEAKFLGEHGIPTICTYKAALRVWPEAPSHSNGALRYWLEDQGLISPDPSLCHPAHRAGPDAYVTAHILKALFEKGITGSEMVTWTKEPRLFPNCPIGEKFRGKPWAEVDDGFLGWMLRQPTMEADLKWNAQREIARRTEG